MLKAEFLILTLFSSALCLAQNDSIIKSASQKLNLNLSYNSSLIFPGATIGFEMILKNLEIKKIQRQSEVKTYTKYRLISANFNWYHHPDFHDNVYLTAEWVMRRTNSKGLISEFSVGPGLSRTFLGGTTYRVGDSGDISIVRSSGYYYALITVGGGFGTDFSVKKQFPFSYIVRMNLISMFPYNSTIYFRPVLQLVFRFYPGKIKKV